MGIFRFLSHIFNPDKLMFGKKYESDGKEQQIVEQWRSYGKQHQLWDPTGNINYNEAVKHCAHLQWRADNIPLHTGRIRMARTGFIILAVLVAIFSISIGLDIRIAILFAIPAIVISATLKDIKYDLIKYLIAKEETWLYHPSKDGRKGNSLIKTFPEIFRAGNRRYVEDQIWGIHKKDDKKIPFHSGLYHYFIRGNKSEHHHINYYFSFKLKKHLASTFKLYPENVLSRFANKFTKKEINVESIAFNKAYAFEYNGKKGEKAVHIVNTLSPAMQEQLVTLSKTRKGMHVLFKGNQVFFLFTGKLLTNPQSKVLPKIKIEQQDVESIKKDLNKFIEISTEIAQYLD